METEKQIEENKEELAEMPSNTVTDTDYIPPQTPGPIEGE